MYSTTDTSSFPQIWKTARISPIPKTDSPASEKDYRPISILPVLSKIFERLVLKQLTSYIDQQTLLASSISGFRKCHSTSTVLLRIRDDILHSMKRGEVTLMVLADYSKAFDTVKFKTILMKMHAMGFSKKFLFWVFDYLCNRRQFVQIDVKSSEMGKVEFGVPQGSILGPIFFNLYVADLHETIQCPCHQYADDTTFYQHTKVANLHHCATEVNKTISRLENYSADTNLALNEDKTKWMLFSTRKMSQVHGLHASNVEISCNGRTLERRTKQKLLGVEFEEHLVWNEHITSLIASCYSALSIVKKLRNLAPFHVRKLLMETLILSKLDYSCTVFHPLPSCQLKRLQRVQNVCAGFVHGRYAKEVDCLSLGWLPLKERRDLHLLNITFKALYFEQWPAYLKLRKYVPGRTLRSSNDVKLEVPLVNGTFQDSAAAVFNNLPADIRNCNDFNIFKRNVRTHLTALANTRLLEC